MSMASEIILEKRKIVKNVNDGRTLTWDNVINPFITSILNMTH